MADQYSGAGGYTRGSRDLDFVTGNPAMDAYVSGQKAAQEQLMSGETIPPEVLQNADVRVHLVVAWDIAGQMYSNNPRARYERMHIYLTGLADRMYQADVAMAEWLIKNGVAKDSNDAWQMVGSRGKSSTARCARTAATRSWPRRSPRRRCNSSCRRLPQRQRRDGDVPCINGNASQGAP